MNSSVSLPNIFLEKNLQKTAKRREIEFLRYTHTHTHKEKESERGEKFKSSRKGKISMKNSPFKTLARGKRKSEKQNITEAKKKSHKSR